MDWHGALGDWCRRHGLGEVFADLVMPHERDQRNKVVCPDLMVALRAERRDERLSYKLWEQPTPEFVLESLSNSTWRADVGAKKRLYRRLGVREYWLFDAAGKRIKERLRGYRLRRGTGSCAHLNTYRLVPKNRWGRRESEVLRLELCVREGELRFYDSIVGRVPAHGARVARSPPNGREPHRRTGVATARASPVRLTAHSRHQIHRGRRLAAQASASGRAIIRRCAFSTRRACSA